MRYIAIITIAFVLVLRTNAQPSSDYQVIRSKPAGDLVLEVWLHKADATSYGTSSISYDWLTLTNQQIAVDLPKEEYFCMAQMFDSASNTVPLRPGFRNLGKHFFDLKYPSMEQPWSAIAEVMRIKPAHGTQSAAVEFVIASQKFGGGGSFYDLEDVFQLEKPGQYKVRLQFQAYERIYKGGQSFTYKLQRFEPLEFTVRKGNQ
jgi:hypothetical protein